MICQFNPNNVNVQGFFYSFGVNIHHSHLPNEMKINAQFFSIRMRTSRITHGATIIVTIHHRFCAIRALIVVNQHLVSTNVNTRMLKRHSPQLLTSLYPRSRHTFVIFLLFFFTFFMKCCKIIIRNIFFTICI